MSWKLLLPTLALLAWNSKATAQPDCSFPLVEPRHWYQDAFPSNETIAATVFSAWDTTSAWVRTGLNLAQLTGTSSRQDLPGDTVVAEAAGADLRLDLVFRILPGPGNYVQIGNWNSGLRRVPTATTAAVANAASANFWESYLADNGAVGTSGNGVSGPGHPLGKWDQNVWNSARCDTAETNLFPVEARLANMPALTPGRWASMYHEVDPKYATLGAPKNRCFLVDPAGAINSTNITCGNGTFPPPWTADPNAGMTPSEGGLSPGVTREFSQIIPDGQLTPGSHVQYFLRVSDQSLPLTSLGMNPDTNFVLGQGECSRDCARWAQFGVLPDRWKEPAFQAGGTGMGCMLVVDLDDGGGNECAWISVADSTNQLTFGFKRGAHNGWARAHESGSPNDPIYFRRSHGGQPGTFWDLYSVRGSRDTLTGNAGALGGRLAPRCVGCPSTGRESRLGPTAHMLRTFYRHVVLLTGDRSISILGPVADRGQDDWAILTQFLANLGGAGPLGGLWAMGSGFAESEQSQHGAQNLSTFRASLRHPDYAGLSGNASPEVNLVPPPGAIIFPPVKVASQSLDVLTPSAITPAGIEVSRYPPEGSGAPYVASVRKNGGTSSFYSLLSAFDLGKMRSSSEPSTFYRQIFVRDNLNFIAYQTCGAIIEPTGVPTRVSEPRLELTIANNPLVSGAASIRFGTVRAGHVRITVHDVAGRIVKTLLDGAAPQGPNELLWEGVDANGMKVAGGIYFVRLRVGTGASLARTLVVLR